MQRPGNLNGLDHWAFGDYGNFFKKVRKRTSRGFKKGIKGVRRVPGGLTKGVHKGFKKGIKGVRRVPGGLTKGVHKGFKKGIKGMRRVPGGITKEVRRGFRKGRGLTKGMRRGFRKESEVMPEEEIMSEELEVMPEEDELDVIAGRIERLEGQLERYENKRRCGWYCRWRKARLQRQIGRLQSDIREKVEAEMELEADEPVQPLPPGLAKQMVDTGAAASPKNPIAEIAKAKAQAGVGFGRHPGFGGLFSGWGYF
jgi:hypothetical protein